MQESDGMVASSTANVLIGPLGIGVSHGSTSSATKETQQVRLGRQS